MVKNKKELAAKILFFLDLKNNKIQQVGGKSSQELMENLFDYFKNNIEDFPYSINPKDLTQKEINKLKKLLK